MQKSHWENKALKEAVTFESLVFILKTVDEKLPNDINSKRASEHLQCAIRCLNGNLETIARGCPE